MFDYHLNEKLKNKPSWWFLEGYTRFWDEMPALREGYARYHMYTHLPIYINPKELIVGNLNWALSQEVIYNNVGNQEINEWNVNALLEHEQISEVAKQIVKEKLEKIKPHTLNHIEERLSKEERLVSQSSAGTSNHYNGHMILDYPKILKLGLGGYVDEVIAYREKSKTPKAYNFYEGMLFTLKGMQHYIVKHTFMAQYLRENKIEGYDEENLKKIEANCKKLMSEPPKNFLEALQLVWFMFSFGDYDSFGRFDQYMYDFYEEDKIHLGEEQLEQYLRYFLNKAEQNRGILNMTIGGIDAKGASAANSLTYTLLKVIRELGYKSPNLCIRLTDQSEQELYLEVHKNLSTGQAIPALYNDKIIIPMLEAMGIEKEDAYNYSLAGCSQVIIPGKSNFACDVGLYNTLKILELTLHNGKDLRMDEQVGLQTGEAASFTSFEALYKAYNKQMQYIVKQGVSVNNQDILARKDMPSNIRTLFTEGCLESGKAIFEGGSKYNAVQSEVIGLTNVANALYAIKKLVYEEKKISLEELVSILDKNYEGHEALRQHILHDISKFGNDKEEVDEIRVEVGKTFYTELSKYEGPIGGKHWAGEVIFMSHMQLAPYTLASADGRTQFEPLADSAGAMQGTDTLGPTALIKSITKIPYTYPTVCRNLNMKFPKDLFKTSAENIIYLFRTYFKLEGCQLQINVLDREDLLKAQQNPEQYKDLVVRIGGYNDYFVEIPKEMQDEVISRTEQML